MRKVPAVLLLALALAVPVRAAESIPADLREAIRMRMDALAKVDIAAWDRLTTDDFTTVLEDARLQTKAERMAQLKGETPQPPAKQLQQRFARYGDVVVDRLQLEGGMWVITVWVKDAHGWGAAAAQVTVPPEKK